MHATADLMLCATARRRISGVPAICRGFHNIVLISPDIPGNTGCIGRTCMATGSRLHLIHPLGFSTDEKSLRRAGLDYWEQLDVREHSDWDAFVAAEFGDDSGAKSASAWLFTTHGSSPHWSGSYASGDYLLFGSETRKPRRLERTAHKLLRTCMTAPRLRAEYEPSLAQPLHRCSIALWAGGAPERVHSWVRERWSDRHRVSLPMVAAARSINLSTSVGVAVYEAQRQGAAGDDT